MANTVLICKPAIIEEMIHFYKSTLSDKKPPGSVFVAKPTGCTITAYKSGKVLFQGSNGEIEAGKWGDGTAKSINAPKQQPSHLPEGFAKLSVIGSDEVGTGDFFGPITVVSAYVKKEQMALLKELGVKDSKNIKDEQIIEIAKQLIVTIPYSLLILHNEKYNELQAKGMTQGKMKALLHNKAILNLLDKISPEKPEAILIDQFVEKNTYYKHIAGQKIIQREKVFFSTKGESVHLSVAAASIIARYAFLREFDKLSEKVGLSLPKGAGKQVDIAAAKIIRSDGIDHLKSMTKWHFANSEKAIHLARR
ncbi:ribonuclease HIII [Bacillus pakistanensis]|uniref:Ribonuclease HIII n=1 Tax=Rossellomorea pakistanensis TaxID=992288 RepID=A0ABS2NAL0_9BACI|nr:ribonuclease HIII [Bacillus pakistanensis]MBM7584896.1 ribonuclease HIII [Bacillus pakistanensis]